MEELLDVDHLIVFSNIALVIVTALAILVTIHDGHKHEETVVHSSEHMNDALAEIVHEVLMQEGRIESDMEAHDGVPAAPAEPPATMAAVK